MTYNTCTFVLSKKDIFKDGTLNYVRKLIFEEMMIYTYFFL